MKGRGGVFWEFIFNLEITSLLHHFVGQLFFQLQMFVALLSFYIFVTKHKTRLYSFLKSYIYVLRCYLRVSRPIFLLVVRGCLTCFVDQDVRFQIQNL